MKGIFYMYIKDARSVSLYPYNRSQILQHVKHTTSINITKEIAKFCDNVFWIKKVKTQQQQQQQNQL